MISCTFAGHREILHTGIDAKVSGIIEELLNTDTDFCFYTGGMGQFDALCESSVRRLRAKYPDKYIRLILVEPYMKQSINTEGQHLLRLYDDVIIPDELLGMHYKSAITLRNRWMIDHSQYLITYIHRTYGGAYMMSRYAERKKRRILTTLPI